MEKERHAVDEMELRNSKKEASKQPPKGGQEGGSWTDHCSVMRQQWFEIVRGKQNLLLHSQMIHQLQSKHLNFQTQQYSMLFKLTKQFKKVRLEQWRIYRGPLKGSHPLEMSSFCEMILCLFYKRLTSGRLAGHKLERLSDDLKKGVTRRVFKYSVDEYYDNGEMNLTCRFRAALQF